MKLSVCIRTVCVQLNLLAKYVRVLDTPYSFSEVLDISIDLHHVFMLAKD